MPIRINLLAETIAAAEEKRRDPVKRAAWAAAFVVTGVLLGSGWLQFKVMAAKSELSSVQADYAKIDKTFKEVTDNRKRLEDLEGRLQALQKLATNRFLWGSALQAFQHTLDGIEDVQVTRMKVEQAYVAYEDLKGKNSKDPKAGGMVEKISFVVEARDSSAQPGDQVNKFKAAIAGQPLLTGRVGKTNNVSLLNISPPVVDPLGIRAPYVSFTLQSTFPEISRQ